VSDWLETSDDDEVSPISEDASDSDLLSIVFDKPPADMYKTFSQIV
jgi:hypothetical protein